MFSLLVSYLFSLTLQAQPALPEIEDIHKLNHRLIDSDGQTKDQDLCSDIKELQAVNPKLYQKILSTLATERNPGMVQNALSRVTLETITLSDFCNGPRKFATHRAEDAGRSYINKGNREDLHKVALALHVKLGHLAKLLDNPIRPINAADSALFEREQVR